jgi:hypothetical protein
MSSRMQVTLNTRLRPLDRAARYEDPLQKALDASMPGSEVSGGGTLLSAEREPLVSDMELSVEGDALEALGLVTVALEAAGAPKGSRVRVDEGDPGAVRRHRGPGGLPQRYRPVPRGVREQRCQ